MNKLLCTATAVALMFASSTPAGAAVLTTGSGDGGLTVTVSSSGAFGSSASNAGDAFYDPVGSGGAAATTFESYLYLRTAAVGDSLSGTRLNLASVTGSTETSTNTAATSVFSTGSLAFSLVQSVNDLLDAVGARTGSLLTQVYTVKNESNVAQQVELTRYFDGDLQFNGSNTDGGGRLVAGDRETLFELDSATGASTGTTFIGIFNEGGAANGFQIASYSGLRDGIAAGNPFTNTIAGDTNSDGFIDTGYDVTLGMGRLFTIGAGQSVSFTSGTIFGSGAPGQIVIPTPGGAVPEPATWGLMLLGFLGMGAVMRRTKLTNVAAA